MFDALHTLFDVTQLLESWGAKPIHVARFWRRWLGLVAQEAPRSQPWPQKMAEHLPALDAWLDGVLVCRGRYPSEDGAERRLYEMRSGQTIESVLLPRDGVCVSSQVGCAVGCQFCMTGQSGLIAQLSDLEIVAQVRLALRDRPQTKRVVFMGMGEPSHNWGAVEGALAFLVSYSHLAHKNLIVSTVGDKRLFERLFELPYKPALALSLHTMNPTLRQQLLPKAPRLSHAYLFETIREYAKVSHYPVQIEWTLLKGVNDSYEEMQALSDAMEDLYGMVNFISVNAIEGGAFERPDREHALSLVRYLRDRKRVATLRDSAAQLVDGGCGQLRARVLGETHSVVKVPLTQGSSS